MSWPSRLIILVLVSIPSAAQDQSRVECAALDSRTLKQSVHYCVQLPPSYDGTATSRPVPRYPVLYLLHGLGDNEQTLVTTGGWTLIDDLRRRHKIRDFLIVTPEGKRSFYINSANGEVLYNDFFLREFMPLVERKYRIRPGREFRAITGMSMGGYGALRLAFAYPQLFSAVSAQSPALVTSSLQSLDSAFRSGSRLTEMLGDVFGRPINVPHWTQNNPFALARRNAASLRDMAIYLNCGLEDDYGFEKGTDALHRQLLGEGIKHQFHLYPGNHSLTYFLTHLGETMEFHSRAFEARK
jgi:S-formylglutathione hydrolase FrmB